MKFENLCGVIIGSLLMGGAFFGFVGAFWFSITITAFYLLVLWLENRQLNHK